MKRTWKKLAALASAAIMALGMATTALADEPSGGGTGSITISASSSESEAAVVGNTYALYQVATFDVESLNGSTVYTNITATSDFSTLQNDIVALADKSDNSDEVVAVANAAAKLVSDSSLSALATTISGSFADLENGYYLIVETAHGSADAYLSTKYILVAVEDGKESKVELKTSKAGVTKKIISETDGSTLVDADTVAIGDTVTYQLDADIPTYASDATNLNYTLTDTMSAGLTYVGITSVQVSNDKETWADASNYTTTGTATAGATVTVSLSESDIIAYSYVRVILTATLNKDAETGTTGNPNSVKLTYSNNYYGGGTGYSTPWDTVITYTGELNILKVDEEDNSKLLAGATFEIRTVADDKTSAIGFVLEDGTYRKATSSDDASDIVTSLTTDDDGAIKIVGLDLGTYYAVETKAPDGYSLATSAQTLELVVTQTALSLNTSGDAGNELEGNTSGSEAGSTANSSAQTNYTATWKVGGNDTATINNKKGTTLPGTGGIGTTLFTFGGLALVMLAAAMFIVYTKKQRKQA